MFSLNLNGRIFSVEELQAVSINERLTDFEKSTLLFCQLWLNGQKEFTINTSGSTGQPKEIILNREAMEASARMTINALKLQTNFTSLVCLDTKHIAGQMMLVRSLILGMHAVAVEPKANPFDGLDQHIDFAALVPYQLENVLDHALEKLNQLRCTIIGGASIGQSLKEKIQNISCSIYATYGMTETLSHIALQRINGIGTQEYFEALEDVQLRLDNRGCLCIKAKYLPGEVVTNDLVELIDERKFKWLGRVDNVINSGGVKVIPEKIEAVIEKIFGSMHLSNRFFIAGIPDDKFGQRVVLFCEGALSKIAQSRILERSNQQLRKYEVPKEFLFVSKFAETTNGKINRPVTLSKCH